MRRVITISLSVMSMILMTGCSLFSSTIPVLDEQQEGMVVEYATETLLSYDSKNGDKIKPKTYEIVDKNGEYITPEEYEEQLAAKEEALPEDEEEVTLPEDEEPVLDDVSVTDTTGETQNIYSSLDEILGMSDVTLKYTGYSVCDTYPNDADAFFIMNSTEGNDLLILNFEIKNITNHDVAVVMPYGQIRYKVTMNQKTKNALTTLLLNDLAVYQETLSAGATETLILATEYTEEELRNVESINLTVKSSDGIAELTLE